MDMNRALLELEQRTLTEMRKMERTILGRMELLHTQLNSKLYFIESKLDSLTDGMHQQQQQHQLRMYHNKRDPHHHRYHHHSPNGPHHGGRVRRRGGYGREFRNGAPQLHYYAENDEENSECESPKNSPELENGGIMSNFGSSSSMGVRAYNNGNGNGNPYNNNNNNNTNGSNSNIQYNNNNNGNGGAGMRNGNFNGPPTPHRNLRKHNSFSFSNNYAGGVPPHHGSSVSLYDDGNGPPPQQQPLPQLPPPPPMLPPPPQFHRVPSQMRTKQQRKQQMMNTYFDGFGSALNKMAAANKWTINGVRVSTDEPPPGSVDEHGVHQQVAYGAPPSEPLKQTHGTATQNQWTARSMMGSYTSDEEDDDDEDEEGGEEQQQVTADEASDVEGREKEQQRQQPEKNLPAEPPVVVKPHIALGNQQQHIVQSPVAAHPQPQLAPSHHHQQSKARPVFNEMGTKKIGKPQPLLVGGFAQALSRMAAANKWSFRHKGHNNTNGIYANKKECYGTTWGTDIGWDEVPTPPTPPSETVVAKPKQPDIPEENGVDQTAGEPDKVADESEIKPNGPAEMKPNGPVEMKPNGSVEMKPNGPVKEAPEAEKEALLAVPSAISRESRVRHISA